MHVLENSGSVSVQTPPPPPVGVGHFWDSGGVSVYPLSAAVRISGALGGSSKSDQHSQHPSDLPRLSFGGLVGGWVGVHPPPLPVGVGQFWVPGVSQNSGWVGLVIHPPPPPIDKHIPGQRLNKSWRTEVQPPTSGPFSRCHCLPEKKCVTGLAGWVGGRFGKTPNAPPPPPPGPSSNGPRGTRPEPLWNSPFVGWTPGLPTRRAIFLPLAIVVCLRPFFATENSDDRPIPHGRQVHPSGGASCCP